MLRAHWLPVFGTAFNLVTLVSWQSSSSIDNHHLIHGMHHCYLTVIGRQERKGQNDNEARIEDFRLDHAGLL